MTEFKERNEVNMIQSILKFLVFVAAFTSILKPSQLVRAEDSEVTKDEIQCIDLKYSPIDKLCVGDLIQNYQYLRDEPELISGRVQKIVEVLSDNKDPLYLLTIQIKDKTVNMTSKSFIVVSEDACTTDTEYTEGYCIGDQYRSLEDGDVHTVSGFLSSTNDFTSNGILERNENAQNDSLRLTSPEEIREALIAEKTGRLSSISSCRSEIPFLNKLGYGHLPNCAKKAAIRKLEDKCKMRCGGNGLLAAKDLERNTNVSCDIDPNLFPPHGKLCVANLAAQCSCER